MESKFISLTPGPRTGGGDIQVYADSPTLNTPTLLNPNIVGATITGGTFVDPTLTGTVTLPSGSINSILWDTDGANLRAGGNLNVVGKLTASSSVDVAKELNITGRVVGSSGADFSAIVNALGSLNVTGQVTASSALTIAKELTVSGGAIASSGLAVAGVFSAADVSISGQLTASSAMTIARELSVTGGVVASSTLQVGSLLALPAGSANIFGWNTGQANLTTQGLFSATSAAEGQTLIHRFEQRATSGTSHMRVLAFTNGGNSGDPFFGVSNNVVAYSHGIKNDSGDVWVLTNASSLNATNLIRASATSGVSLLGTTVTDLPPAGYIGEYASSSIPAFVGTSGGTTEWTDMTMLDLTPGDWDATLIASVALNGATMTQAAIGISSTSGNSATGLVEGNTRVDSAAVPTGTIHHSLTLPAVRLSLSAATRIYGKFEAIIAAGQPQYACRLSARRIR